MVHSVRLVIASRDGMLGPAWPAMRYTALELIRSQNPGRDPTFPSMRIPERCSAATSPSPNDGAGSLSTVGRMHLAPSHVLEPNVLLRRGCKMEIFRKDAHLFLQRYTTVRRLVMGVPIGDVHGTALMKGGERLPRHGPVHVQSSVKPPWCGVRMYSR